MRHDNLGVMIRDRLVRIGRPRRPYGRWSFNPDEAARLWQDRAFATKKALAEHLGVKRQSVSRLLIQRGLANGK